MSEDETKGKRPWFYNSSVMQAKRGRLPMSTEVGVLGLSDDMRQLLNVLNQDQDRWFTPKDFEGTDPHRYTKLARLQKRGLLERRRVGKAGWEYRVISS